MNVHYKKDKHLVDKHRTRYLTHKYKYSFSRLTLFDLYNMKYTKLEEELSEGLKSELYVIYKQLEGARELLTKGIVEEFTVTLINSRGEYNLLNLTEDYFKQVVSEDKEEGYEEGFNSREDELGMKVRVVG